MSGTKVIPAQPDPPKCPQCGTPLPGGALAGLCPACLLKAGVAMDSATEGKQPPFTPPSVEELAPLFPQLEILSLIGKGGMGAVYRARQKQLDRIVALKILPPGIGDDPAFAERFAREAKALAKLNHPGIVTLFEFGSCAGLESEKEKGRKGAGGQQPPGNEASGSRPSTFDPRQPLYYFLMEFVDGVNLRQLLHAGRISAREALAIVPQICDALQFAHDQGIVHRDIKPENILLDRRGRVKVADFGLAKIIGTDAPLTPSLSPSDGERVAKPGEGNPVLTDAGKVMGTPQYMSPEQKERPQEVDHRADIYALGVVFYQMLTGELPGKNIEPPSKKVSIDVRLDEVVLRALEQKPELRYQQASILKTQVETITETPLQQSAASDAPQWWRAGFEYRSKATLFGLPWLHVTAGPDPLTGRERTAKGIVAIGGKAKGIIALGGVATGVFAFGGVAMGGCAFGGVAAGLVSFGGLAIALIFALGGGAVAPIALGGGAIGYLTFGAGTIGVHAWDAITHDPTAGRFFLPWAKTLMANIYWFNLLVLGPMLLIGVGVPLWLQRRNLLEASVDRRHGGEPFEAASSGASVTPQASTSVIGCAAALTFFFAGVILSILLIDMLPFRFSRSSAYLLGVGLMLVMAPFVGVAAANALRRARESGDSKRMDNLMAWFKAAGAVAGVLALPVIGFALFFLFALTQERGGWNPNPAEAVLVPLSWVGAVLLPVSFWLLMRSKVARGLGMMFFGLLLLGGLGVAVWSVVEDKQTVVRLEQRAQADVGETKRLVGETGPQNSHLKFGPVVESVLLAYDENPALACLDLGGGELHSPSVAVTNLIRLLANNDHGQLFSELGGPSLDWLKSSGVDLIGGLGSDGRARIKYIGQPPHWETGWASFENADPQKVIQMLQVSPFFNGDKPNLPSVYVNVINPQLESVKRAQFLLFRTHDGDAGIMQVLGEKQNPRGVKIRYKLIERSVTTTAPVNLPAPTHNLSFGPVTERVLYSVAVQRPVNAEDLDGGRELEVPAALEKAGEAAFFHWLAVNGADVLAFAHKRYWDLWVAPKLATVPAATWDNPDVADLTMALQTGPVGMERSEPDAKEGIVSYRLGTNIVSPLTFAFQTSAGGLGLLQITGFTENPRGVKIRYKRAQGAEVPTVPIPSKTILLTRETNQLVGVTTDTRTVGVWTDSTVLPGETLRALVRKLDGTIISTDGSLFTWVQGESMHTSVSFDWTFKENDGFGATEAEQATAQIRDRFAQRPITLRARQPLELFCVTNSRGGTLAGFLQFETNAPVLPDANGQVKTTVTIRSARGIYPMIDYSAKLPPGYTLRATTSDTEARVHTSASRYGFNSSWFWHLRPGGSWVSPDKITWHVSRQGGENATAVVADKLLAPPPPVNPMPAIPRYDGPSLPQRALRGSTNATALLPLAPPTNAAAVLEHLAQLRDQIVMPVPLRAPVRLSGQLEFAPFDVVQGKPKLIFSITNGPGGPGEVLHGFLELVGPEPVHAASVVVVPNSDSTNHTAADPVLTARLDCMNSIRQTLLAAMMYAETNRGEWPVRLADLKPQMEQITTRNSFAALEYCRPKPTLLATAGVAAITPVLFEANPVDADGECVGFADGHVEFVKQVGRLRELRAVLNAVIPPDPSIDLEARLKAAERIMSFTERDGVLASIAADAAKVSELKLSQRALGMMASFAARDDATLRAGREFMRRGERAAALQLAESITAFSRRDAAVKEFAK